MIGPFADLVPGGRIGPPDAVLVVDPAEATWEELASREPSVDGTGPWLEDGFGWAPGRTATLSATDASLREWEPPIPLVFLGYGTRQRSADGLIIEGDDMPSGMTLRPPCRKSWVQPAGELRRPRDPGRILHDTCRQGRLHDIRWDVDGRDVLMLIRRGRHVRLSRIANEGGRAETLAHLTSDELGAPEPTGLRLEVDAIAPGPRDGELLLALRTEDRTGPLVFYSTIERIPVTVDGSFAGFFAVPIDA